MPKTALEQWDETAANNTDIGGVNIDEGCAPSGMNNAHRAEMAQIAAWLGDDTVASAATADLGAVPGRYINITGTTTITAFGTIKAGTVKYVKFAGILTLTHNATSLILPGAANITTAAGDTAVVVSEGSGNWRCLAYQRANGQAGALPVMRGHIFGLILSNNTTDATNDIDFTAGEVVSDGATPVLMTYASAMTKRLDANWAAGTGNGGRNSASAIADTLYRWYAVSKANGAAPDFYAHTSDTVATVLTALQAETGGADYIHARRIGDVHRAAGVIRPFTQDGDTFRLTTGVVDIDATISTSRTLHTVTAPPNSTVILRAAAFNASAGVLVVVQPVSETDAAVSASNVAPGVSIVTQVGGQNATAPLYVATDASTQIASRASAASTTFRAITIGWIDTRGRFS